MSPSDRRSSLTVELDTLFTVTPDPQNEDDARDLAISVLTLLVSTRAPLLLVADLIVLVIGRVTIISPDKEDLLSLER